MDEKKKKVLKITGIVAIVMVLLGVIGVSIFKETKKVALQSDPEIRRSMEYEQVADGDENTNSPYVQFDAFFLRDLNGDGYAESIRGTCRDISDTDTLYMEINTLTNGTFKNGKITINSQNMNLQTAIVEDNVIKQNYISDNTTTIELKDMVNGTQKLMYGTVKASDFGNDTTKYSKINSITLTGTHVADNGTKTQVSKTVDFTVDWHGDVQASIYNYTGTQNIEDIVDETNKNITLSFSVTTREDIDKLILKSAVLEGKIPEINGYKPTSVETTSTNVDFNYDSETGNFTFRKEATLGENGIVSNAVSDYNTFSLKVTYPYEVYEALTEDTISIQVPVQAYYEGYNNPSSEFENPIKSNIAERTITFLWRRPQGEIARFDATIGEYRYYDRNYVVSKEEPLKLYNGTAEETKDLYTVRWGAYTGNTQVVNSIQMKETQDSYTDRFLNSSNTYFNMSDYTNNIGIYFSGVENTLGEDGYIKVINDETGEEIHTFTKEDWGNYSSSNPYKYETPVKHIRIETSKANESSTLYVYNIKEIDDNVLVETFERAEFDKLQYVYTYLTGNIIPEGSSSYTKVNDDTANALYEAPISYANITVNRDTIGTQTKEDDINLTINTQTGYYNMKGWTNGKFIIELPEQILDVEINDVTISNSSVKILGYEIFEKNGQKFIRIETENTDEASYSITVNTNLTADPRAVTQTTNVKLYGYNEACDNYKTISQDVHDIDGDENLTENVNYATDSLFVVSPSSLLTNQQATDYNEKKETVVAPQIATIDKTEADTANINVSITNNYEGTISELDILGKIPFKGNTFSINGTDLGSNFTTEMLSEGITVPDDMKDKVTVYYSENENPTNDLNNGENGWKKAEEVTNWSAIKTYLIDLGDYVLQIDETREFSYKIKVPSTVQYNDVSYSTHAVYFSLDTEQGKYRTQTETSKLGFRIERKYNFNIEKIKENTEVPVQGATFSVTADGEEESRIGTTNNSGNIEIENLYVDKTYTLKEIRTPGSYETLGGNIRFKVSVADDKLVLNILEGENLLKEYNVEQASGDTRGTINLKIENTPKYKLEITKKDQETGGVLEGVKYRLEGEGLGAGITATTNKEGKLILTGLTQDVEYTLTEIEADGYYVSETPVKFKVQNNSGNLSFVVTSGSFVSNSQVTIGTGVTGLDAQDTVTAELTDEKIPTYSIKLKKLAKDEEMTLKGAQYMITGEGFDEDGETFITDDQGIITIPDLYEYVEGKNVTGVYTLKEITPPEGYSLDERELQFKAKRNNGNLELEIIGENFAKTTSVENAGSETPVINIELEDEPLFKLTKVDAQAKTPIPNAKFVIYEIDESYNELGYAKDINGNQIGTVENGVPVVVTDENGVISYGLKSGLYKAVEIEAPEGYELPENEEDRTYYFGIDASKTQETEFGTSIMNQVSGANWEKVESVDNTSDNGYVVSGYFYNNADFNKDGVYDVKGNENNWSGFVAKYDEDGNLEFAKPVYTLDGEVKLHKVIQTNDGGYVAVGYYTGSNLIIGDATAELEGKTYNKALIVKFGSSGEYQWCAEQERADVDAEATALGENLQGNVLVGITYEEGNAKVVEYGVAGGKQTEVEIPAEVKVTGIAGENNQQAVIVSEGIADTTTGRIDTYQNGSLENKMTLDFNARDVARLDNGKYVVVGSYTGTAQSTAAKGNYDGIISVYDLNSNIIESSKFVRGTLDDVITSVKNTTDGGYIVGGYTYSSGVDLNNDNTNDISSISGNSDGFVIKYSEDGTQELVKQVQGNSYDQVEDVTERDENEFVAVGYFNSSSIKADKSDSSSLSLTSYSDGFMFNYGEVVTAPEIPETSEITVENKLKQYKITTDVEEVNGVKGGSISGEDEEPYETVEHGKNSIKEIKIIPDAGYKVLKITINGQEYNFTPEEDGTVTLPQFTDMRTDKHIVVSFSNTVSSVIVHHYIDGTKTQVAPDETLSGNIGDDYTTAPKMDLEKYELKKDEDGNYVVPSNASGKYSSEIIEVIYYYVEKEIPLTVHHYIEGTEEKVPLKDGGVAEDVTGSGKEGESYTTSAVDDNYLSDDYELVEVPENSTGTYSGKEVVVTYYYKKVEREVLINKYSEDGKTPLAGVEFNIKTKDTSEDIGTYTTNENGQISVTLEAGEYVATEVSVPEGYDMPSDNETEFSVTKENDVVTLNITNTKTKGTVITHHYIEGTEEKVPSNSGSVVEDVITTGVVGDIYATKEAENVAPNYEFVRTEGQTSGNIVEGTTEVIYYYRLKEPEITSEITKESSIEKVTEVGQTIDYTVNYNVSVDTYIGNAEIKIVDYLPYEIDESKAYELAGGIYDAKTKTITWTESISDINTFDNGIKEINITKEISLVYKDVITTESKISNRVVGTINLETPEKEEEKETTKEIPTEYLVSIPVEKVWDDNENLANKRPSSVMLVVKNGTEEVAKQALSNSTGWTYTFTNLPKYDAEGNKINYIIEEQEVTQGDLYFYDKNISGSIEEGFTITNKFNVPDEKVEVNVNKQWVDTIAQEDKRPSSVTVVLKNGETEVERKELSRSNNWEETFTNLAKYDSLGNEINYTVEEVEVNKFYVSSISGDMENGYVITNVFIRPTETIDLTVNKVWADNGNEAGKRPESVTIKVTGNGETYTQVVTGSGDTWTYTFTGLPKYDANGDEIEYTVDEEDLNNEFYLKTVDQETDTVTNTFNVPGDNVTIKATKAWDDNGDLANKRPESVTLQIKDGERIVATEEANETNNWTVEFTVPKYDSLGNEINYTVDEADLENIFYTKENSNITGDMTNGYTVTNSFEVPDETVEIPVTKIWDDNGNTAKKRPESVTVKLTGSDKKEYTQVLSVANVDKENTNNWTYTFRNLPKYDNLGNEVVYTLSEEETGSIFYTKENTVINQENKTITNKFVVPDEKIEIPVTKIWMDANNLAEKRPDEITLKLTGSDGQEYTQNISNQNADVEDPDNWVYTFKNLPKYDSIGDEITYTLSEEPTGSIFYTEENTNIVGDKDRGFTVTNRFEVPDEKVTVNVSKQWVDEETQQDKRPSSVTVVLKNGETEVERKELNSTNAWKETFTNLAKYDSLGNEINYTVEEVEVNKFYVSSISGDMENGYTITNTFQVADETIDLTVNKAWADNGNEAGKRPESVTLKVTGNGETYTQVVTGSGDTWTHTFTGLPKYDANGDEIEYTVDEEDLNNEFYLKTVDQETDTVTNTFNVPGDNVTIKATKAWDDNGDLANKRPESVTLQIKDGERIVATEEANIENNWTVEFTVPKYDSLGNEINYTVDEADLGNIFYTKENSNITGDMTNGFTVTNKFEVPDEKVEVNVNKRWVDTDAQKDKRPSSVTVVLKNGETEVGRKELNNTNNWTETFTDLPKYDSLGNVINYTVEEVEVNKFYVSSVSGNMESGYVITNTFTRPEDTVSIIANKVWNDNTEQASRRPESVTLIIKNANTGEEIDSKVVTKDNAVVGTTNKWSVEFTGLDKYDADGNEIKYTLEERETNEGDLHFYEVEANNVEVQDNQATIRNNFVRPEDVVSVKATKVWNDDDNVNERRPSSIKLQVKNGENVVSEQVVTEDDNWTYTFTDLPKYDDNGKEIVYTISEVEVNTGDLKFYTNDGVSGDMTSGYIVTNTFTVPDEKIELTVNKVWEDNDIQAQKRPSVVVINVLGEDGSVVATYDLNTATETSHTFTDLPKYNSNGQEINYTVQEQEKNPGDLHFYTGVVGNVENTSENSKEVTITNTFEKPDDKKDVTVTKVWDDNDNSASKRPESIKLLLKNGTEIVGEQEVAGETTKWEYTFTGLPKYDENGQEIKYTVDEEEVNKGDLQFYNKVITGLTVTNTFTQDTTKVNIPVTKVWNDNEEQSDKRPESIVVILKANEIEKERYELSDKDKTDENTWQHVFEGLPKYDINNNIINYTVEEEELNSGDLKFYTGEVDGTTITNTFTKPVDTIDLSVNKVWQDQEDRYGKRPVSVRVNVLEDNQVVQTAIITEEDNWEHTFTDLAKYDENGNEIEYTVSEEEVIENDLYYYTGEVGEITTISEDEKELTITNNMTKIPGTVIIKYVDKNTGEEISEEKTKEGIVGEEFDVTDDVKEIPGYTLVEEPEEKTGTYTPEVQEKIYYYAKDTSVIVKYLEKDDTQDDGDNKVLADEVLISGYEGEAYKTEEEIIPGYTLVETKGDLSGTMTSEQQVVVYYYSKDTKVIVRYLEKDETPENPEDNKELLPEKTIEGYVGEEYTTTEEIIPGYTLVQKTTNFEGIMTEEVIEVIYYYAKDTSVIVKYLEKGTDKVLADEILIEGYEGKDYETEEKDIENYTFVEDTGNTKGKMEREQIEVIYYYAQNTKAKVEHIDRETGEILKEETEEGKVGDLFETHPEDFEGYVLVESPEEPDIIMDNTGEQVVRYYYAHVSAGVIEKHIDIITGELLDSSEHKGNEGDHYDIPSKEFSGYDLVTDKLPDNSSGEMKRDEVIEVKYYYIKKATVIVKYVDEATEEEIEERETIEGHENDPYDTEAKDIDGYELSKTPENASGKMTITKNEDGTYNTEIEVIYYYKKISGGVIENHIDIDTNKKLAHEEHKGYVGDEYDIPSREFDGYDLVTDKLPNNSKGKMTEEEIVVNYYYKKKATVRVEYIDKQTGEKITEDEIIKGHIGDEYTTEEKEFDGYDLIEKPSNGEGSMTEEEIVVKYYYIRKAEVEVKYLEKGTDYEVAKEETISGHVGDKYETEQKEVPYYKFVEKTENWKGEMTEDKITVIYYYEKQIFNLGVDKWVGNVSINGISTPAQSIASSNEIYKVDVHRTKAETADVRVTYKIRITNKGEIEGNVGKLTDIIPAGYSFYQEDNNITWENNNGVLTTEELASEIINSGEYKEIEVTLRCNSGAENYGQKDNMVILTQISNPAGYEDIDKEDNNDTSRMIITIATGLDRNDRIIIIAIVQIVLVTSIGLLISYKKRVK